MATLSGSLPDTDNLLYPFTQDYVYLYLSKTMVTKMQGGRRILWLNKEIFSKILSKS